jgi:hypothetical protein
MKKRQRPREMLVLSLRYLRYLRFFSLFAGGI